MRKVTKVQTFDGILHDSQKAANSHLDRLYGKKLTKISLEIRGILGKYDKTMDFIDQNLDAFLELKIIKDDMAVEEDDD
jgi:hypothetical protein